MATPLSRRDRSPHTRNVAGMHAAPRCGARTRAGGICKGPCVGGKSRCRMHGGADGSGGQPRNRNALKHGHYTAAAKLRRRVARKILRDMRATLRIVAFERLIGTEAALALARAIDSEPELPLPPSCDWRAILKDAGHGDDLQRMDPMARNWPAGIGHGAGAILRRAQDDGRECAGSPSASSPSLPVRHAEPPERQAKGEARRPHGPQCEDFRDDLQRLDPMVRNWPAGIGQGADAILRHAQDDDEGEEGPIDGDTLPVRHAELVEARRPHGPQTGDSHDDLQRMDPMVPNAADERARERAEWERRRAAAEVVLRRLGAIWPFVPEKPAGDRPADGGRAPVPAPEPIYDDDDDDWYMTKGTTPGKVWDSRHDGFGGAARQEAAVVRTAIPGFDE